MQCTLAFVFIVLILQSTQVLSQTVVLTGEGLVEVKGKMSHLRDPDGSLTIDDVRGLKFSPLADSTLTPSYGFDRSSHWFQFTVINQTSEANWLVEVPFAPLDKIELFTLESDDSVYVHKRDGDMIPIPQRELAHRHPIFKLTIKPGTEATVYLRIETISSVQVPILFWQPAAFHEAAYETQLFNGLFYGIMLALILYQLFLFLSIKDRSTLYYVLTLLSMANVIGFFQGYTFLYLYPEQPYLNDVFAAFSGPVFVISSALLTRSLLNLRQLNRWLDNLIWINALINTLVGILVALFIREISYKYLHFFVLNHCLLILASAGYCLYLKYRPALFYLLGWATLLIAAVAFTLGNLGILPGAIGTNYLGLMIGCILQVMFISLALGERWNVLVKENQQAKEMELRMRRDAQERLEREVRLRTEEIQYQNRKLEEVNQVKDKLFSVVSHDIRGPLASLKFALSLSREDNITHEEFKELSVMLENRLGQTTEFIQNLLQWAKLQLQGGTFEPEAVELSSLLKETEKLLEFEIRQKQIQFSKNIPDDGIHVFVDLNMIRSVFRNLMSNAVKFTPDGGSVSINVHLDEDEGTYVFSVTDTGVGIPSAHYGSLFTLGSVTTPGTHQEAGTGLGLVLCKEFVEKNGGTIWFESEEGKGTTFSFSLPLYKKRS